MSRLLCATALLVLPLHSRPIEVGLANFRIQAQIDEFNSVIQVIPELDGFDATPIFGLRQSEVFLKVGYATLKTDPVVDGEYINEGVLGEIVHYESTAVNIKDMIVDYQAGSAVSISVFGSCEFAANSTLSPVPFAMNLSVSPPMYPYLNQSKNGPNGISTKNAIDLSVDFDSSQLNGASLNRVWFRYDTHPLEQGLFGLGVQYSHFNLRGQGTVPVIVTEGGVGRGLEPLTAVADLNTAGSGGNWHTTYSSVPVYSTDLNYSVLFGNSQIMIFELSDAEFGGSHSVEIYANDSLSVRARVMARESLMDIVSEVSLVTGRMRPVPDWVLDGAILGIEGGQQFVTNATMTLLDRFPDTKLAGLWIQDWTGVRYDSGGTRLIWNWQLNTNQYPDWNAMADEFRDRSDTRMLVYLNPNLVNASQWIGDGFTQNYFDEAISKGYFVRKPNRVDPYLVNSISFVFGMIDTTNRDACEWYKTVIKENLIGKAQSFGWMTDFGEYVPLDATSLGNPGVDSSSYHNRYPQEWARLVSEAIKEYMEESGANHESDDFLLFYRSGSLTSPKYAREFWLGDQMTTYDVFDGLLSALYGHFSGPFSGHSHAHSDIGGYTMFDPSLPVLPTYVRTPDLLMRWIEMSTFSDTTMRSHPGTLPDSAAQIWSSNEIMAHFSRFSNVWASLKAYKRHVQAHDAYEQGFPCLRHLIFHFGWDERVYRAALDRRNNEHGQDSELNSVINSQFMFGDCLLMAPVFEAETYTRDVYLPSGEWTHYFTGQEYSIPRGGGQLLPAMSAPIGTPLVFVCPSFALYR